MAAVRCGGAPDVLQSSRAASSADGAAESAAAPEHHGHLVVRFVGTPPASRPTDSRRSACRSRSSAACCSSTSVSVPTHSRTAPSGPEHRHRPRDVTPVPLVRLVPHPAVHLVDRPARGAPTGTPP